MIQDHREDVASGDVVDSGLDNSTNDVDSLIAQRLSSHYEY